MASEGLRNDELCQECGKQVVIYNEDFQFSWELHLQSHKHLETINQEIEMDIRRNAWLQSINSNLDDKSCHKSTNIAFKNNVPLTIDQNTMNPGKLAIKSGGQSTISKSKSIKNDTHANLNSLTPPIDMLTDIFSSLPSELKAHQGFIIENKNGNLLCNICKVTVSPIASVTEHLKTRLHEDRIIKYFTGTLSKEFHHIMEFVSFNNSILCCNLCRFNFDLCPNNPNETIFSIMKHNLSKIHLQKISRKESCCFSDLGSALITSLSQLNQVINDNQHCLEFRMQLEFRCKLCNIVVCSDLKETSMYKMFINHFMSEAHINTKAAYELKTNDAFNTHYFTLAKDNIYCSVCNCYIEPNIEALTRHVGQINSRKRTLYSKVLSYITSIKKTQLTTNTSKNNDHPNTSSERDKQGNQSVTPECLSNIVPLESNNTYFVDEPDIEALTHHGKQIPSNEILHSVSSVENDQVQSFLTSLEKNQPTKNNCKSSDDLSTLQVRDSQRIQTGNSECLLQKSNNSLSVDGPNFQALTCQEKQISLNKIPQVPSLENCQVQSFLTSIEKIQLTTNNFKNTDDPSTSPGSDFQLNQSQNPQNLLNPEPPQSNITNSVDETNVPESDCYIKPSSCNEAVSSFVSVENEQTKPSVTLPNIDVPRDMGCKQPKSFSISTEKNVTNTNHTNDLNTTPRTDLQKNNSQIVQSMLKSLPQNIENSQYIVQNEQGKLMCSVCKCEIPLGENNAISHLLGKSHKKCVELTNCLKMPKYPQHLPESPNAKFKFIETRSNNKSFCFMCNISVSSHISCLREHVNGSRHKKYIRQYKSSKSVVD